MQKVITVTNFTGVVDANNTFNEHEYPELTKHLNDGYIVKDTILVSNNSDGYRYSITFVLAKKSSVKASTQIRLILEQIYKQE